MNLRRRFVYQLCWMLPVAWAGAYGAARLWVAEHKVEKGAAGWVIHAYKLPRPLYLGLEPLFLLERRVRAEGTFRIFERMRSSSSYPLQDDLYAAPAG